MNKLCFILLILSTLWCGACFTATRDSQTGSANQPSATPAQPASSGGEQGAGAPAASDEIRKADFKNFTYQASCGGDDTEKITVRKGEFSRENGDDKLYFNVTAVTYGDVDGDRRDDAIILTVCNTGGTGQFAEGFVYTLKDGKPALLTRIEGGDRADGGLRSAKVENGYLVVDRNNNDAETGACCPEIAEISKYKWNGKELTEVGSPVKRDLYPATRVSFPQGATSTTLNVTLPAGEMKRFTVGASRGQILTVTTKDTKNFSASLSKGDANSTDMNGGFYAALETSGDFVIQVQNSSDKEASTVVTIEIE
jgi:hypothetical protein